MIYKKFLLTFLAISLMTFLVACGAGESRSSNGDEKSKQSSSKDKIEIVMGTPHPTTHHAHRNVYQPWIELVKEKTGGRVSVSYYPNSTLGSTKTALEDISNGVYDVGLLTIPYLFDTPFYPYTIASLPFAFPDVDTAYKVSQKFSKEFYQEEAFKDLVSLGDMTSTDPYVMFSTKSVKTIEDVKGMKIQVPGDTVAEIVKAWGATPVSMSFAEVYESLERGAIDATIYTPVGALGYKIHEVAPYILKIGVTTTPMLMVMNKKKFESLPKDIQEIFNNELYNFMSQAFYNSYKAEYERAMQELGKSIEGKGEIVTLPPEELNKFVVPAKDVWDAWVEEANKRGYEGDLMMKRFKEMLKEEGVQLPF